MKTAPEGAVFMYSGGADGYPADCSQEAAACGASSSGRSSSST